MNPLQILKIIRIYLLKLIVGPKRVFHLLNFDPIPDHGAAVDNVADFGKRKGIRLNPQRGMNRSNPIIPAQPRPDVQRSTADDFFSLL